MKPVLLSLGPVHVYSFGVLVALGVLISLYGMVRDARESGILSRDAVYDLLFVTLLAGFAGGRLFYIVQNLEWYSRHPLDVFALWEGGLIFYGGLMGGLIGLAVFCRWKRVPYIAALDFMAPYLALSHAFGRVGCFLNGCCVGSACELPWAVHFPGDLISRHPAQLYEAF